MNKKELEELRKKRIENDTITIKRNNGRIILKLSYYLGLSSRERNRLHKAWEN